jgi:SRSO17 transposase
MAYLMQGLGHADRHSGLTGYCTGLMLPLSRKSVEPIAARVDPLHASAKHQSLHHFVAKAQWSDQELLRRVAQWVVPLMDFTGGGERHACLRRRQPAGGLATVLASRLG